MKLTDLVPYLVEPARLGEPYRLEELNPDSEAILMYAEAELDVESELRFFDIEVTDDEMVFSEDGIKYVQLFPLDHAIQLIESDLDLKDKGYSNEQIAQRLVEYAKKDA